MEEEYDEVTSYHYSMYRPPLHEVILDKCLNQYDPFNLGLDIGCGTGVSSLALSLHCKKIIGVDPSKKMIENVTPHPQITYQVLSTKTLPFGENQFDLLTFAGSLYYAKSQVLLDETIRVGQNKALVLVYDFNIELNDILGYLTNEQAKNFAEDYNHQENFSGLIMNKINKLTSNKESIVLQISADNLIHLLLSSKKYYKILTNTFTVENLEQQLKNRLQETGSPFDNIIQALIYYTVYEIEK